MLPTLVQLYHRNESGKIVVENITVQINFAAYKFSKWGGGREIHFYWLSELQDTRDLTLTAT